MDNPNANIILRRKYKSKAKTGDLYLKLMMAQLRGENMEGMITKKCREIGLEPIVAMKGIRKYLERVDGKSYRLSFTPEIIETVRHFIEQYEILRSLKKQDKNIILSILISQYYYDR